MKVNGDLCHDLLKERVKPKLAFSKNVEYATWKDQLKEKFFELIGIEKVRENACPLNFEIESEEQKDGYKQIRFTIESEIGSIVPVYVLIPDTGKEKYPVAIVLQGHSSGFHNSIGAPKNETENDYALGRGKFAVQAVQRGYIAIAIEQRGMGERRPTKNIRGDAQMCAYEALTALAYGRTILAERMWDVSKVIDALENFSQCDLDKIFITGNSGGGTMSFYAACLDERIKLSVPSCAFCSYKTSILDIFHCACNYIPHAIEWFEMEDLSALIAPRKLVAINGRKDSIFPIEGVRKSFETVEEIFAAEGCLENCRLVETDRAHWWCEEIVWSAIEAALRNI